jgi:hypothetical protein
MGAGQILAREIAVPMIAHWFLCFSGKFPANWAKIPCSLDQGIWRKIQCRRGLLDVETTQNRPELMKFLAISLFNEEPGIPTPPPQTRAPPAPHPQPSVDRDTVGDGLYW